MDTTANEAHTGLVTQNSESVKLQNQTKYKSNNHIISIGFWEASIKAKSIVTGTDATTQQLQLSIIENRNF